MGNTKLSVNINKIATLRNARGHNMPDVVQVAIDCEHFGAQGITVHPRPDQRHIKYSDVFELKEVVKTEFNIEGYPSDDFIAMVIKAAPTQVTLVPDPPDAITSNNGWDCLAHQDFLKRVITKFHQANIRTSIFLNPDINQVQWAKATGTDRIELYTEGFASGYKANRTNAISAYKATAYKANELGLGINAGHDLNLENLTFFVEQIPHLLEVSIGHALICDSLYNGLHNAIQLYLNAIDLSSIIIKGSER
jgi:pyridoxine 5-phosphate synthase